MIIFHVYLSFPTLLKDSIIYGYYLMITYNTNRNAFFKSINIFSLRKIFFKNNHYTEKVIFYKAYTSINSKKWITIKLPDPKYTVRSIYTPDTKPKSIRNKQ